MEKKSRAPVPTIAVEDDERHSDDVSGYIVRNRAALNASIKRGRAELAKGKASAKSMDTLIAEGRSRFSKKR